MSLAPGPMTPPLTLFDPTTRHYERWPAQIWTHVSFEDAGPAVHLWVPTPTALAYAIPGEHGQVESPIQNELAVPAIIAAARAAGVAEVATVRMFDGYYYDAATHVVGTYQQDMADAAQLSPLVAALLTNRPPAAPATV